MTNLATAMVSQWGMSDKLGNINYTSTQESFLGSQSHFNASDESRELIDQEVRRLVDEAYERAKKILKDNWQEMENLAQGLLEYETLTGEEYDARHSGRCAKDVTTIATTAPIRAAPRRR